MLSLRSHGSLCAAGSFGAMDPAGRDLYMFLEKLQQQQKEVVNLIKERQRTIAERDGTPTPPDPAIGGVPASPVSHREHAASPAGKIKIKYV